MRSAPRSIVAATIALLAALDGCSAGSAGSAGGPADADVDGTASTTDGSTTDAQPTDAWHEAAADASSDTPIGDAPDASATRDAVTDDTSACGVFTGATTPVCSPDGTELGQCTATGAEVTDCPRGCLRSGTDGEGPACLGAAGTNAWSCTGSYGKTRATDGDYYLTEFGCYTDGSGGVVTDPGDNCIPSCLDEAIAAGLCPFGSAGPDCEEKLNWYTADGARFGCLHHVRITNPATGAEVVAIVLDYGPACSVESTVGKAALDASGPVNAHLFGGEEGISDRARVHVVEVDESVPLGIVK